LFLIFFGVWAHLDGAGTCTVQPNMDNIVLSPMPVPTSATPGPYAVGATPSKYVPGMPVTISVAGAIEGIMMYGWDEATSNKIGSWNITGIANLTNPSKYCPGDTPSLSHGLGFNSSTLLNVPWTAPVLGSFNLSSPTSTSVSSTGFSATISFIGTGSVCFVTLASGAAAPSPTQVMAGQDSTGSAVAASQSGCQAGTSTITLSATGLTANTSYSAFFAGALNYPQVTFLWYMVQSTWPHTAYRGWTTDANILRVSSDATMNSTTVKVDLRTTSVAFRSAPAVLLLVVLFLFARV